MLENVQLHSGSSSSSDVCIVPFIGPGYLASYYLLDFRRYRRFKNDTQPVIVLRVNVPQQQCCGFSKIITKHIPLMAPIIILSMRMCRNWFGRGRTEFSWLWYSPPVRVGEGCLAVAARTYMFRDPIGWLMAGFSSNHHVYGVNIRWCYARLLDRGYGVVLGVMELRCQKWPL